MNSGEDFDGRVYSRIHRMLRHVTHKPSTCSPAAARKSRSRLGISCDSVYQVFKFLKRLACNRRRLLFRLETGTEALPTILESFCIWHTISVAWEVEFTDEFQDWWTEGQQDDLAHSVRHLIEFGPALGFPHSSKVTSSRYPQMRELRTQSAGRPLRTLYAFNPLRTAVLLLAGYKTGDDRWYDKFVPVADRLFEEHLNQLKKEGKL
jgi:hypothetical protein